MSTSPVSDAPTAAMKFDETDVVDVDCGSAPESSPAGALAEALAQEHAAGDDHKYAHSPFVHQPTRAPRRLLCIVPSA